MKAGDQARVHLRIQGIVQGVFFRASTRDLAIRLNLCGWVRNLINGDVEVLAEGDRRSLKELADWCRHGPPGAQVRKVEVLDEEYTGEFNTFQIRF